MTAWSRCCCFAAVTLLFASPAVAQNRSAVPGNAFGPGDAAEKVYTLVNKYFAPGMAKRGAAAVEESGLYKVTVAIQGRDQAFYISKDGALLIYPNGVVNIAKFEQDAEKQKKSEVIPKAKRPVIELFIMSLCPYGIKAEQAVLPVAGEFGDTVDFRMRFITQVGGDTIDKVNSLHGRDEVREDAREAMILRSSPGQFPAYLDSLAKNACVLSCGGLKMDDFFTKTAAELKLDARALEADAYGPKAVAMFRQDEADVKKYEVSASPTLVINGVKSQSVFKGKEDIRKAICSAFAQQPAACH